MTQENFGSHFYTPQQECYKIWENKNNPFFGQFSEKNCQLCKKLKNLEKIKSDPMEIFYGSNEKEWATKDE